jgi:uncharacterized membrane protein
MSDTLKQIAFIAGLMLVGILAGMFWHAHGGTIWLIPLLAFAVPLVVLVVGFGYAFLCTDWSH